MKTYTALAASALIVAATMNSATAMKSYLEEIPNGSSFSQELGHPGSDSSKFTKFATAFSAVDHTWTAAFCKETFPGASMTNGEAFGDPCCTWKKGGTPDFTVTAFTTTPGKATTCAAGGASGKKGAGSASTPSTSSGSSAETPSTSSGSSASTPSTEQGSSAETPSTGSSTETPSSSEGSGSETPSSSEGSGAETPSSSEGSGAETPSSSEGSSAETPSTGGGGWSPPATGGGCAAKGARKFRH
ncbi:hypothetical protein PR003_g22621 [Phytophthora rubi]|uniref:Temptin Cys/Cys disulfide domain-containing protein n=1 Tax=Phytophthora rubi TaxID=129364 RepID=A0A6A4D2L7_9STRA|nr:hypothetical protein PR001_g21451 [Phytophthora rubi]KAE9030516.1 hypothetical protein PR002_g9863 [Phytophthora rubi]KAE9301039.1 hypothetical protein PR003_g22621 [Phytophthora rubi]